MAIAIFYLGNLVTAYDVSYVGKIQYNVDQLQQDAHPSDGMHSRVSAVVIITTRTCHATYILANNPHFLRIPFV